MLMLLPIATMRVEDCEVASPQCFAPDLTIEILQALPAAAHERTEYDRRVLVEGRTEHRRHRQDDVAIDHPRVEHSTHLAHPVVHVDFGAPQAQRRFAAHRHPMGPLTAVQAAVCDIAHQVRVPTRQHLGHQAVVIRRVIPRMGVLKRLPVLSKDLPEDIPGPRRCYTHQGVPS